MYQRSTNTFSYTCKEDIHVREERMFRKRERGGEEKKKGWGNKEYDREREGDIGRPTGSIKDGEIIEEHVSMEFSLEFLGVSNTSIKSFIIHSMNKYTKS